jgi:AcrR family transcriptional regulator
LNILENFLLFFFFALFVFLVLNVFSDHFCIQTHGVYTISPESSSLRKLAAIVGTSDRMLLHYFADKEELMTGALTLVTERRVRILESARIEQMPFQVLLPNLAEMMNDPQVRPYLRLSLELVALAAEKKESYSAIARKIWNDFFGRIASALQVEREEDHIPLAALALATTEGFMLLDALGCGSIITNALEGIKIRHYV